MGTHFFWDPVEDNIIQERDDTGAVTADYTTEPYLYGDLISQRRSGESRFYCFDGQGSTRALTDVSGSVTDTNSYTAFGQLTEHAGITNNPFQFVGQKGYVKQTNFAHLMIRRRLLSPLSGRWLSVDPLPIPDDVNQYRYVQNLPPLFTDPAGLLKQIPHELGHLLVVPFSKHPYHGYFSECGGFAFVTDWQPDKTKKEDNGLIIQKVCVTKSVTMCDPMKKCQTDLAGFFDNLGVSPSKCGNKSNCADPDNYCYIEVWKVAGGSVFWKTPFSKTIQEPRLSSSVDVFAWPGCKAPCTNCTKGMITRDGDAFFISEDALAKWNDEWRRELDRRLFVGQRGVSDACYLASACWNGDIQATYDALLQKAGGAAAVTTKHVKRTWNCCPPNACGTGSLEVTINGEPAGLVIGLVDDEEQKRFKR